jgi:hypothetical protein
MNTAQGSPQETYRKTSIVVGALFLIAMVTSLMGGGVLESVINAPGYLSDVSANTAPLWIGVALELINAIAVVGIAVMLFPILRQVSESIAVGYVAFRIIESVACVASAITPLSLLTLSRAYVAAGAADAPYFQTLGAVLLGTRADIAGVLIPIFFGLGALLFYYALYRSRLVPRFISVWGLVGVVSMLAINLGEIGLVVNMVLALPIILNEIVLGVWLIAKGFNSMAVGAERPSPRPAVSARIP